MTTTNFFCRWKKTFIPNQRRKKKDSIQQKTPVKWLRSYLLGGCGAGQGKVTDGLGLKAEERRNITNQFREAAK